MKQQSLGLELSVKKTRKRVFLEEMNRVVPWGELVALIAPYTPEAGKRGRQPFAVGVMAAHPFSTTVVWPVRPGHGRSPA